MANNQKLLWTIVGGTIVIVVCCLGIVIGASLNQQQAAPRTQPANIPPPSQPSAVPPTIAPPTVAPTLAAPSANSANPAGAEFQAMAQYGETIRPILEAAGSAAERDGAILEASKENPEALCQGSGTPHPTLTSDAALMSDLGAQLQLITPPAEMNISVHKPLIESAALWSEALQNINQSCLARTQAERDLLRLGAMLQLGGSLINFHVASDNFWRLVIVNGLEAVLGSQPGNY